MVANGEMRAIVGGAVVRAAVRAADSRPENAIGIGSPPGPLIRRVRKTEVGKVVKKAIHASVLIRVSTTPADRP